MDDLAEKRVYAGRTGAARLVAATADGLVVVAVADDRVGEYGMARRCSPRDVAVGPGDRPRLAVATDEDVLLADAPHVDRLEPSGFGPAVAVSVHDDRPVAGSAQGRIGVHDGTEWWTVGTLASAPTALDDDLVGSADGVFRLVEDGLARAGLAEVADVAHVAGVPHAATATGLYALGNGWLDVLDGDVELVAGAPDGRAHAATAAACYARVDGAWTAVELPTDGAVAAVAYGARPYALTSAGELLVETADGWQAHPIGLAGARAVAVLERGPG